MKKFLLSAAVVAIASSASADWVNPYLETIFPAADNAEGVDLTPAGFKFNTCDQFIGVTNVSDVQDWNANNHTVVNWVADNGYPEAGLVFVTGGGTYCPFNQENFDKLNAGMKIVDLGGTCGKVLAMNMPGSGFGDALTELTGSDQGVSECAGGYAILFWTPNPDVMKAYATGEKTVRMRIECNVFMNNPQSGQNIWKAFMNDDENNVKPNGDNVAPDIMVTADEFAYRICDMAQEGDDVEDMKEPSVWEDDDYNTKWNPNRWLVYELDFNMAEPTGDGPWNYCPKIKMEIPGTASGSTLLFRNIQFYVPTAGCDIETATRKRTWKTYTVGGDSDAIEAVAGDTANEVTFAVNGQEVTFSADAEVYSIDGAKVADAVAGQAVTLAKGFYVANAGGKGVKFIVK